MDNYDFTHFSNMNRSTGDSDCNQCHFVIWLQKRKRTHEKKFEECSVILVNLELLFRFCNTPIELNVNNTK